MTTQDKHDKPDPGTTKTRHRVPTVTSGPGTGITPALGLRGVGSTPEEFARFVAKDAATIQEVARRIEGRQK